MFPNVLQISILAGLLNQLSGLNIIPIKKARQRIKVGALV